MREGKGIASSQVRSFYTRFLSKERGCYTRESRILAEMNAEPLTALVNVLRAQAKGLDLVADALEVDGSAWGRHQGEDQESRAALGAADAAAHCSVGETSLREYGPPPRYVGGRALWLIEDLDRWLRELPTDPSHRRGRRRAPRPQGGMASL